MVEANTTQRSAGFCIYTMIEHSWGKRLLGEIFVLVVVFLWGLGWCFGGLGDGGI